MRTIERTFDGMKDSILFIGYVDENAATQVQIDCAAVLEEYPEATVALAVRSPQNVVYNPESVSVEDGIVTWTVTSADMTHDGWGAVQVVITEGDVKVRSGIANLKIEESVYVAE